MIIYNRKVKGAITVFMCIVYMWVYILMGFLVDGGRVRMAKALTEEAQQLATESVMTMYHQALYQHYDLFGETTLKTEAAASEIEDMMEASLSLDYSGDLLDQTRIGVVDIGTDVVNSIQNSQTDVPTKPFDLYNLKVDHITAGANLNLGDPEVFRSQVSDSMKYKAPILLAQSFFDFAVEMGGVAETAKAVKDASDKTKGVYSDLGKLIEELDKIQENIKNYCHNTSSLSESSSSRHTAGDFDGFAGKTYDQAAVKRIKKFLKDNALPEDEEEDDDDEDEEELPPLNWTPVFTDLNKYITSYEKEMKKIPDNAKTLVDQLNKAKTQADNLKTQATNQQTSLEGSSRSAGENSGSSKEVYSGFAGNMKSTAENLSETCNIIDEYIELLENIENADNPSLSSMYAEADSINAQLQTECAGQDRVLKDEAESVAELLVEDHKIAGNDDTDCKEYHREIASMISDLSSKAAAKKLKQAIQGDDKITGQYKDLKDVGSGESGLMSDAQDPDGNGKKVSDFFSGRSDAINKSPEDSISNSHSYGKITGRGSSSGSGNGGKKEKYSSEDADDQLKEVNNIDKQLVSWLTDGVEGLYECVYVMHNFRDCVHVNSLTQENNGRNQYDTALNVKFLKTGNENSGILNPYYLTPSEFTSIETSCAEAEYVVFGLEDTKQDAVAAYGSIFGLRLALDYVSVYMTSELRNIVMETAAAAGPFAPAVYALLPLAFSVPRAGLDMYLIMNSKLTPFMYREMDDWVRPEFKKGGESTSLLVGYGDYLLFMLLTKGNATRTKRVQDVVEMNIAKLDEGFKLDDALVGIYAHSDCSVRYLFMSQSFMPAGIKRDGRYKFSVNTAFTY